MVYKHFVFSPSLFIGENEMWYCAPSPTQPNLNLSEIQISEVEFYRKF